jgi:hypothetical protein
MIGPEQGVSKPTRKSSRNVATPVATPMSQRRRCAGDPQEQRYRDDGNFAVPRFVMTALAGARRSTEGDFELLCNVAIRIHRGCSVKIAQ